MSRLFRQALFGLFVSSLLTVHAATYTAPSCSQPDVQTTINSAVRGDTVIIPAGTCAWSSGVSIAKSIKVVGKGSGRIIAYTPETLTVGTGTTTLRIQSGLAISAAQTLRVSQNGQRDNWMQGTVSSYSGGVLTMNISSTGGGGSARRWLISTIPITTIIHNSAGALFTLTEDTVGNVNVGGFKVARGSGNGDAFVFNPTTGGRPILLNNCWIEQGNGDSIQSGTNRGVVWNCSFDASPFSMAPLVFHHQPMSITNSWTTKSTMGAADTTGENNFYFEDNDFHAYLNATDVDSNGRAVFRHNLFNNAGIGTHGADTGPYGVRHFEYYENTGVYDGGSDGKTFPMNWWIFVRGGTYVIANNVLPALQSQDYNNKPDVNMTVMNLQRSGGPNPCWAAGYHVPRQVGMGNVTGTGRDGMGRTQDSVTYVGDSEPAYIWGNKRPGQASAPLNASTSDYGQCNTGTSSATYIVNGRDYFNTASNAKPGWTPYTYPHPLTDGTTVPTTPPPTPNPVPDTTAPSMPVSPSAAAPSTSAINLTWTASTDDVGVIGYRVERCQDSACTNFAQIATPSGTSYNDTGLGSGVTYRYRVRAFDAAGNVSAYSSIVTATTMTSSSGTTPSTLPSGNNGIAARYPGDANIQSDPAVLFADDFESYSTASQLTNKWSSVFHTNYTRIATEPGNIYAGNRALEFRIPQQSAEVANEAVKNLSPGEDVIFMRTYTKFEAGYNAYGSSHNGLSFRANYCCPGVPADGMNKFYVGVDNSHESSMNEPNPGFTKLYVYHPEQRSQWGDLWYPNGTVLPYSSQPGDFGPTFVSRPNFTPELDRWYSYEMMVKANTPGQRDGRIAVWIDGVLIADFPNVRLRDVNALKIDKVVLTLHIGSNTVRQNIKWYDNVVVARSYIGPMFKGHLEPPTKLVTSVK